MKLDWDEERVETDTLQESGCFSDLLEIGDLHIGVMDSQKGIDPYLKIRKCDEDGNVVGVCRISLTEPKYITGYNENFTLTDEEKEALYNSLQEHRITNPFTGRNMSNWDVMVESFTEQYGYHYDNIYIGIPLTDYRLLKEEK